MKWMVSIPQRKGWMVSRQLIEDWGTLRKMGKQGRSVKDIEEWVIQG